jgi:hypothetical protein
MPNKSAILLPMFALFAWTAFVLLLLAYRRVTLSRKHRISTSEFALGESSKVPLAATLANRNYMNLLELPMLFYVGCLMAYATGMVLPGMLVAAWVYVGLRVVHSVIHLSYNHVMQRFAAFAASNVALIFLWVLLAGAVFRAGGAG